MLSLLSAVVFVALQAAPAIPVERAPSPPLPVLSAPQAAALRCGVVFAMGAKMQAEGKPAAASWPPLDTKGREFFVRTAARIMEETGADRTAIQALAAAQLATLKDDAAVLGAVPGCLVLLDAAGL